MKKTYLSTTVILAMTFCPVSAMAWGPATHAYIAERLNNKGPLLTLNQVYGAMAGDVFTFISDPSGYGNRLNVQAHCSDGRRMWNLALLPTAKAQAYGFISHNQAWGADYYAHDYSCPENNPPQSGYIHDKAVQLASLPEISSALEGLDDQLKMELLRSVVEYAVDILIKRLDPAIGAKVSSAALLRSAEFPILLNTTFALDLARAFPKINYWQATKIISAAESQFRQIMLTYGQILSLRASDAIDQLSAELKILAAQMYGVDLSADLIKKAIKLAMGLCLDDYCDTIKQTIEQVSSGMVEHGFYY